MAYLSKLVKRISMGRSSAFLLLGLAACSHSDNSALAPAEPLTRRNAVSPAPVGTVSDLRVVATTDTSATLSFTEVDNGTGSAANYDVRVSLAPISWSTSASVTKGSCATPVAGTVIGHSRTCVVYGLSALSSYGFQLVSFRGTLDSNAVFGPLSNVATTTTVAKVALPVAYVSLTPGSLSGTIGQVVQFTATAKDALGAAIPGKAVSFGSTNPAVISISQSGVAMVVGSGSALIGASIDGRWTTSAVTVAVTAPTTVNDLRVLSAADTFATLTFTQVQDGTGAPASYLIQSRSGSSSPAVVTRGTCAQPVAGTAVGTALTCTVLGLRPSTFYTFQLEAIRGKLAAFVAGAPSNVAAGATVATIPVAVAAVSLSPSLVSGSVGTTIQFMAVLKDVGGNVLRGRSVSWTSSNASVASVTASGGAIARSAGVATISATSGGVSGSAVLTVTAPPPVPAPAPSLGFANEPAGMALISDYGFSNAIPNVKYGSIANGWQEAYNDLGNASMATDPTAPMSGPSVAQVKFPAGFVGGSAPVTLYYGVPQQSRFFAGFEWKVSNPWQGHPSNVNKVAFFKFGNDQLALVMYGPPGGPYYLDICPEFAGIDPTYYRHIPGTPAVTLDQWHRIELALNKATGVVQWWMDGTLIGTATMPFPASGVTEFQFSPTWGGLGSSKLQDDYYWFDHVRLSGTP